MPTEEFEKLKEALREAPTEEARKAAAEAMRRYLEKRGRGSRPMLVSLATKKRGYPTAVPLNKIPEEMERNPAYYNLIKKVITKEK